MGILLSVHEDRTDPNEQEAFRRGLSKDRLQEYRRLLRQLGLIGVGTTNGEDIMFQVTASGFLGHGTRKGYLYSSVTLRRPTTTTAEIGQHRLEPIAGHWYLYYDVD